MKALENIQDFFCLLFGIRTTNNTEGYDPEQSWLRTVALPFLRLMVLLFAAIVLFFILISLLVKPYVKERNTSRQLKTLSAQLIRHQQKQLFLPASLVDFVANDPLKRDLTLDSWGNPISYQPDKLGLTFTLVSAGRDQQLGTEDDLVEKAVVR